MATMDLNEQIDCWLDGTNEVTGVAFQKFLSNRGYTREWTAFPAVPICVEAAAEIERLRERAQSLEAALEEIRVCVMHYTERLSKRELDLEGRVTALEQYLAPLHRSALASEQEKVG